MGLPRPPAFLDPTVDEGTILENGLNYASGGGGILNDTGSLFVSIRLIYPMCSILWYFIAKALVKEQR